MSTPPNVLTITEVNESHVVANRGDRVFLLDIPEGVRFHRAGSAEVFHRDNVPIGTDIEVYLGKPYRDRNGELVAQILIDGYAPNG